MPKQRLSSERADLLADVAEMYFLEGKNQSQIAKKVGVTRSMVSRMLTDARRLGIVEIHICRPLESERDLELALVTRFGLEGAFVLTQQNRSAERLLQDLGTAGAHMLTRFLAPNKILGLAWGTAISATVDAVQVGEEIPVKVVQLVGAVGAHNKEFDAHALVQRLVQKLGGEGYYLNAPFFVENPETVRALLATQSLRETLAVAEKCDLALLGIGSTEPKYSSFYKAGYVTRDIINALRQAGAVGDVCGWHFDLNGNLLDLEFHHLIVTLGIDYLSAIPIRLGVAGGVGKARPILGALRGKLINVLVADSHVAKEVLRLDRKGSPVATHSTGTSFGRLKGASQPEHAT